MLNSNNSLLSFKTFFRSKCHRVKIAYKKIATVLKKSTCVFKNRRCLVIFLLNVLLNIKKDWKRFCKCNQRQAACAVCEFKDHVKKITNIVYIKIVLILIF